MNITDASASPQDHREGSRAQMAPDHPKSGREELRISLSRWRGRDLVSLRIWYEDEGGTMRPRNSGFALKASALPDLQDVIAQAMKAARIEGLI